MSLVKTLGERYLWVDALCIVQDDPVQKHLDIQRMDFIYSKAFATIVAMHGKDADAGLPGVRGGTREPQRLEWVRSSRSSPGAEATGLEHTPKLSLVSTAPPLQLALELSKWDSRGWTFQERLLSRRCIYFSRWCVYFQCRSSTFCEMGEELPKVGEISMTGPVNPFFSLDAHTSQIGKASVEPTPKQWDFQVYKELVEMYTSRELSFSSDILEAFSGILGMLGESVEGRILKGLPTNSLDLALLWNSTTNCKRRSQLSTSSSVTFRSWSWTGWEGLVWYRIVAQDERTYPTSEIDAFYIHQNGRRYEARKRTPKLRDLTPETGDTVVFETQTANEDSGPRVLQFSAAAIDAKQFTVDISRPHYLSVPEHAHSKGQEAVVPILDSSGRHCGILVRRKWKTPTTALLTMLPCQSIGIYRNIRQG